MNDKKWIQDLSKKRVGPGKKLPTNTEVKKAVESVIEAFEAKEDIRRHEALHKAQAESMRRFNEVKPTEDAPIPKLTLDKDIPVKRENIKFYINPSMVKKNAKEIDLYFPLPGVDPKNVSVNYDSFQKDKIVVSVLPTQFENVVVSAIASYVVDFTSGTFLNFSLDNTSKAIIIENGMMRISLRRELEVKKKETLNIPISLKRK